MRDHAVFDGIEIPVLEANPACRLLVQIFFRHVQVVIYDEQVIDSIDRRCFPELSVKALFNFLLQQMSLIIWPITAIAVEIRYSSEDEQVVILLDIIADQHVVGTFDIIVFENMELSEIRFIFLMVQDLRDGGGFGNLEIVNHAILPF